MSGPWTRFQSNASPSESPSGPSEAAPQEAATGPWSRFSATPRGNDEAAATGPWNRYSATTAPASQATAPPTASNETSAETARLARSGDQYAYKPNETKAEEARLARNNRKVMQGTVQGAASKNHEDFARGLGDTLAFGYRDEIAAKYNELVNDVPYDYALAQQQALDAEGEGTGARLVGQVVGGVATSLLPVGALARGVGLVGKLASPLVGSAAARFMPTVAAGAIGGGLYGSGSAEEGERLGGALEGAAIGGVLGGAVQQVAKAGTAGYRAYQGAQKAPALPIGSFDPKAVAAVFKGNDEAVSAISNEGYVGAKKVLSELEGTYTNDLAAATTPAAKAAADKAYLSGINKVKQATRAFTQDGAPLTGEALITARKQTDAFFDTHKADILHNVLNTEEAVVRQGTAGGTKFFQKGDVVSRIDLKPKIEALKNSPQWSLFTPAEKAVLNGAATNSKGFLERESRKSPFAAYVFDKINHPLGLGIHALVSPVSALGQTSLRVYGKAQSKGAGVAARGLDKRLRNATGSEVPYALSQGNISSAVASNPAFNGEMYQGLFGLNPEEQAAQAAKFKDIQEQVLTEQRRIAASGG